jgi:hypothetical protein
MLFPNIARHGRDRYAPVRRARRLKAVTALRKRPRVGTRWSGIHFNGTTASGVFFQIIPSPLSSVGKALEARRGLGSRRTLKS